MPQTLEGIRVLDLGTGAEAGICTKLLAGFGADVVKVEPPAGDPVRLLPPFIGDRHDPELSAVFLHLNPNKSSLVLDLRADSNRQAFLALVPAADVVVESFRPGALEELGLGWERLRSLNPRLVLTRITRFGQSGPYRDFEATDFVVEAMGGDMAANGLPGMGPLRKPGRLSACSIGLMAAEATLAAQLAADQSGAGSEVDVAGFEVLLSSLDRRRAGLVTAAYSGADEPQFALKQFPPQRVLPCADGLVMAFVTRFFLSNLLALLGDPELDREFPPSRLGDAALYTDEGAIELLESRLRAWLLPRDKRQVMEEAQRARLPITPVLDFGEVLAEPHFRARGIFTPLDHPRAGRLEYVGAPWRMEGGWKLKRPAPLLGERGREVASGWTPRRRPPAVAEPGGPPLKGIRVLDLTIIWAGNGATMLLGDLGAEVVKVESVHHFPTNTRGNDHRTYKPERPAGYRDLRYPGWDPGRRPFNRAAQFNGHSRNKRSVTMDLDHPLGREAFLRLVALSDVLVENFAPRVLRNLDLEYPVLREVNPRLVMARMPGMGLDGPNARVLGFGANFNSLAGITAISGYEGSSPETAGASYHMDEISPPAAALAVLAALRLRQRTGAGQLVEVAQVENLLQSVGEFLLHVQAGGPAAPAIIGNSGLEAVQGCVPTDRAGRWLAISLRDECDWAGLARVLGSPAWATEARFRSHADRLARQAELFQRIGEVTRACLRDQLFLELQAAGVPAGPVLTESQALSDPQLAARGYLRELDHPEAGRFSYPSFAWRASGFEQVWGEAAPLLGQHNDLVYRELLGYSAEEYERIKATGMVGTDYALRS
jgi:crotonobetainyl-CoA:carnitine CoA-transferase CaiB-like acyl-CoA transferase